MIINETDKENLSIAANSSNVLTIINNNFDKENIPPQKSSRFQQINSIPISSKVRYNEGDLEKDSRKVQQSLLGKKKRDSKRGCCLSAKGQDSDTEEENNYLKRSKKEGERKNGLAEKSNEGIIERR